MTGGLVLGTAVAPTMENITYTNCTVEGALAGIRIKFRPSQPPLFFCRNSWKFQVQPEIMTAEWAPLIALSRYTIYNHHL